MIDARCLNCPSLNYCPIPTDGPLDAEVICYGERPGQQEEFTARKAIQNGYFNPQGQNCFIGDAGDEFNENYLRLAGLDRGRVRVGNIVLCGADGNKHPTPKLAGECGAGHIGEDIRSTPGVKLVVLMGGVAAGMVDERWGGMDLEAEHGIPRWVEGWFGYSGWLVAMYHPAAGLHNTSYMIPLLSDWETLGRWLKTGEWQWPTDQYPEKDFRLARTPAEVDDYWYTYPQYATAWSDKPWLGGDSERHGWTPYSLQISIKPGTGVMVLEEDEAAIERLGEVLAEEIRLGAVMTMHNAEADLEPFLRHLRKFGVRSFPYRDTLQEIYHIGSFLRQGLKVAALRVLGRRRQSWEEVVGGASRQALMAWLWEALGVAEGWRQEIPRFHKKTGKPLMPEIVKHPSEAELKHVLTHTSRSAEYDSWKKVVEFGWRESEWWSEVVQAVGRPMPIKGIGNCDLETAKNYGCQDASDHLELALALERMRKDVEAGWAVREEDWDVVGGRSAGVEDGTKDDDRTSEETSVRALSGIV